MLHRGKQIVSTIQRTITAEESRRGDSQPSIMGHLATVRASVGKRERYRTVARYRLLGAGFADQLDTFVGVERTLPIYSVCNV